MYNVASPFFHFFFTHFNDKLLNLLLGVGTVHIQLYSMYKH